VALDQSEPLHVRDALPDRGLADFQLFGDPDVGLPGILDELPQYLDVELVYSKDREVEVLPAFGDIDRGVNRFFWQIDPRPRISSLLLERC